MPSGPVQNLATFTTPIDFTEMKLFSNWADKRHFDVDRLVDTAGNAPPELILRVVRHAAPGRPAGRHDAAVRQPVERRVRQVVPHVRPLGRRHPAAARRVLPPDDQGADVGEPPVQGRAAAGRPARCDLDRITMPLLHAVAEHDHIVPYDAARAAGGDGRLDATRKSSCSRAATSASWPGATRSSGCGRELDAWLGKRST